MIRFVSWLITLPLCLFVLGLALNNRGDVTLSFWPFDLSVTMPLSLLLMGLWLFGLGTGQLLGFIASIGKRIETRRLRRHLQKLQDETTVLPPCGPKNPTTFLQKIKDRGAHTL